MLLFVGHISVATSLSVAVVGMLLGSRREFVERRFNFRADVVELFQELLVLGDIVFCWIAQGGDA